jgi:phenylacetate-CoA ligase
MSIETIYQASPYWLKNIAANIYAIKIYRTNYNKTSNDYLRLIKDSYSWTSEQIYKTQLKQFKFILKAASKTAYYEKILNPMYAHIMESDSTFEILSKIPLTEKQSIKQRTLDLTVGTLLDSGIKFNTSGTSGSPLSIYCTPATRAKNYAFFREMLQKNGCDIRDRSITFAGRKISPPNQTTPPFWVKEYISNTMYCSSYHISEASIFDYIQAISKWNPRYIDSYPSAMYEIASLVDKNKIQHNLKLKAIFTSSETLHEYQREKISDVFNCKIVDLYGCTEMAIFAAQEETEAWSYAPNPLFSIVEILNDSGLPASAGEEGEVICTPLLNNCMPLLRYRIGDRVLVSRTWEVNGFRYYTFKSIIGRNDDTIITPEGRRIGRLDPAFKGIKGISAAQIHQTGLNQLIIRIEVEAGITFDNGSLDSLIEAIKARTSPRMEVSIEVVDRITRTANGKFRSVISDIHHNQIP